MLAITPENIRAEMSRHRLTRAAVCELIRMHPNEFSMLANGVRPLSIWSAHNIGWGMNTTTGLRIFHVDMSLGPVRRPRGRPQRSRFHANLPVRRRASPRRWKERA